MPADMGIVPRILSDGKIQRRDQLDAIDIGDCGAGFFQRCRAKSTGSTPEERYQWREGLYDEIQELMPLQGS